MLLIFYNRKEHHSIILQAVCDDKRIFTDVFIGMPGRVHDARVFRNSPLYNRLIGNPPPHLLPPAQHLLGDAAYPLLPNLLKPLRDNGHLNEIQLRFNQILSAQRSVIERAFALLKGKWRRLKYIDMSLSEEIPNVILAACILHNFVLNREMVDSDDEDEEEFNNVNIEANDRDNDFEDADNGTIKRNYIATLL
ncbi:hypothetical protein NQ317_011995 [Molorchus minor]|uniref:DDE Tnp4 domain-containing protein n=1 Tax=Molorchus minor TaxID=1323400 RepID=A0ABQ9JAF6_9CUCU|nr:hypothetical protein NQ317_011995 [Molorchus minor]